MLKLLTIALGAAITVATLIAAPQPIRAAEPSAVEKLYADLAKMPAAERAAKIVEGAKKEGKFDALSANIGTEWDPHDQLWAKAYPDVKMQKIGLMSAQVAERFRTEEASGKHLTDLLQLSTADSPIIMEKGYAASYPTPAVQRILPKYQAFTKIFPDNRFMPTSMTEHGMIYNFKEIPEAQAPKTWFDLCKPEFKKKVGYDPIEDRLLIAFYTMLGEEKAKQLIQCIGANDPLLQEGHIARIQLMQAGDHPISGDALIFLVERTSRQSPDKNVLKVVYSDAILCDAFGIIISKNASHPYAAALYADFELSEAGQVFLQERMRGPIGVKHPFLPDDAQIVTFGPIDQAIVERLRGYWTESVLKKSAK